MKPNLLKKKIADGVRAVGAGSPYPIPTPSKPMPPKGWDSVTLDMQHGASNINDAVPLMVAIQSDSDATPLVRVPWNDPARSCAHSTRAPWASSAR
jgi:4-hydroxy-2-oxoheptanedioate aldolase